MFDSDFIEPTDPTGNLVWRVADDGGNILVDSMTGQTVKRIKPIYLPDGTSMDTMVLFRVEAARDVHMNGHLAVKQGDYLIARKIPNGDICLFTSTDVPFLLLVGALIKEDFNFITDLKKIKDGDLKMKLGRLLKIENYEYAAQVRDELLSRGLEVCTQ